MKSLLVRSTCLSLAAGLWTAAQAQSDDSIPFDYIRTRDWTFSVGARMSNEGAKVKFGRLGSVPWISNIDDASLSARIYENGLVVRDGKRPIEGDDVLNKAPADPKTAVTPAITVSGDTEHYYTQTPKRATDGTIMTDANGNAIPVLNGRYLLHQPGVTRSWSYRDETQLRSDGTIAMSAYSSTTNGASLEREGDSGAGIELSVGRRLGSLGKRFEWGVTATMGISDINVKTSDTIQATLHKVTDFYSLNGQAAPRDSSGNLIFNQPTLGEYKNPDGTTYANSDEITTRLAQDPISGARTEEITSGGAQIDGHWQIKGSYYLFRVGPNLRATITERLSLNASIGLAGVYLGTKYRADERLVVPGVTTEIRAQAEDEDSQFIAGFYGELTAEFWLTERTGFYAGATYENLGDYEQVLNGRTAEVELGSGLGIRFGITTRF